MKLHHVTAECFADKEPNGSWTLKLHINNVPEAQIAQLAAWLDAVFMANTRGGIDLPSEADQGTLQ